MSIKPLPSQITDDELLKQLSDEKQEVSKKTRETGKSFLLKFLNDFNIEPGDDPIKQTILYKLYHKYEKSQNTYRKIHSIKFHHILKNYLENKNGKYFINQNSFNLSEKILNFLAPNKINQTKVIPLQMHFQNFIKKYDLKPGKRDSNIWVSTKTLYDLYDEWVYSIRKKRPLSYHSFCSFCIIYFPKKREIFNKLWLSLDDSISTLIKARISFQNEEKTKKK